MVLKTNVPDTSVSTSLSVWVGVKELVPVDVALPVLRQLLLDTYKMRK